MFTDPFVVRNLVFGIEDSLISTTGVLVGVAAANFQWKHILVTAIILILIEASSMAYGAFLSETSFLKHNQTQQYTTKQVMMYATTMFLSYVVVGMMLLLPFMVRAKHPIPYVLALAWTLLIVLVYTVERDTMKLVTLSIVGGLLMVGSVGIGRWLKL